MSWPPLEIHLNPDARPQYISSPSSVPLHCQEQVKADLDRDVCMGVIDWWTGATAWLLSGNMMALRGAVNLQPLNKHCRRKEWVTTTPLKQGQPVPKDSFMAVNNAWNGCHSALLRILDQHLTSFITLWGHNCYCRNPQGFFGAGDG